MKLHDRDTKAHLMRHYAVVERKRERVKGLRDLLAMWEDNPDAVDYVRSLKVRLRSAETQLKAMGEEEIPES